MLPARQNPPVGPDITPNSCWQVFASI